MCNCNCNPDIHRVTSINADTTLVNLSVTNNTNIGNLQPFVLLISKCKRVSVAANPLPVTVTINGTAMPLLNKNGIQIQSNMIPECGYGKCVLTAPEAVTSSASTKAITAPYVILYNTPKC